MNTLLVIGDSVVWGQGLTDNHKLSTMLAGSLNANVVMAAHSGATIGIRDRNNNSMPSPEVPNSYPTIQEQVDAFSGNAADVGWVLMNGGINDVSIYNILNPFYSHLGGDTKKYCAGDMLTLLGEVLNKFPAARVLVVGYYPILSYQSDPTGVESFFSGMLGVNFAPMIEAELFRNGIVDHCLDFWKLSTQYLKWAVENANISARTDRVTFVDSGMAEANAAYGPDPLLWALDIDDFLAPEDEVAGPRHAACDASPKNIFEKQQCYRASAGHPNVAGAARIAEQCRKALNIGAAGAAAGAGS